MKDRATLLLCGFAALLLTACGQAIGNDSNGIETLESTETTSGALSTTTTTTTTETTTSATTRTTMTTTTEETTTKRTIREFSASVWKTDKNASGEEFYYVFRDDANGALLRTTDKTGSPFTFIRAFDKMYFQFESENGYAKLADIIWIDAQSVQFKWQDGSCILLEYVEPYDEEFDGGEPPAGWAMTTTTTITTAETTTTTNNNDNNTPEEW